MAEARSAPSGLTLRPAPATLDLPSASPCNTRVFFNMAVLVSRFVRVVCVALLLLAAGPSDASTIVYRTDAELIALSDRVVHGRAVRQRFERPEPGGAIYTVSTIAVLEDFTGVAGLEVDVWELGGADGIEVMWVGGQVTYELGAEVLVCLRRGRLGFQSVGMGFSKFDVSPAGTLTRNVKDALVLGAPTLSAPERTLDEFRDLTERTRGVRAVRNREAESLAPTGEISAGFTFLGPYRWTEADAGTPITWYVSTYAPSPLLSGDGVAELQLALQAWTAPSSASIILQYAGSTSVVGTGSGLPNGTGVLTFEDPNGTINNPTLAVGGGFAFTSGGGTVNGQAFGRFTRGYVLFQNAADLSSSFRQSTNFARVLEHEIGHTIGLGHSEMGSANIMNSSCCSASTPIAPALGPDDLAGLNFIYPSGTTPPPPPPPPSCSYSISPASATVPASGGPGSVSVTAGVGCGWSAAVSTGSSFLSVTSGSSGSGSGTVVYAVAANASTTARSGTLAIAGRTFTVNQAAGACTYTLSAASATAGIAGGASTVTVSTAPNCSWTAATTESFLTVNSGVSGTGSGTVGYTVLPNGAASFRVGTITIAGQAFVVTQAGSGPAMSLDKPVLNFGAVADGVSFVAQTTAQPVRLTQTGTGTVTWTAASNVPWLIVSPTSGSGSATVNVSVVHIFGLPGAGTVSGSITFAFSGAGAPSGPIATSLTVYQPGSPRGPIGVLETPVNNATGITGSIAVTGWAVDDIEVTGVRILRDPVPGEGTALIPIGNAVFVDGARPDVAAIYTSTPRRTRGGWGYLLLTNFLPNQGDGTFRLHAYADDADGHSTLLGSSSITCTNTTATAPFGAIDVPEQGAVVSGVVNNFGWVLTRGPALAAPPNGTVTVLIDGVAAGSPGGWTSRSDLTALFPIATFPGITAALGVAGIDTTRLTNGLHTIAWIVTDSNGQTAGIGSRYFIVQNASAAVGPPIEESPIIASRAGPEVTIDLPAAQSAVAPGNPLRIAGWAIDRGASSGTGVDAIHVWAYPASPSTGSGQAASIFLGAARTGDPREDVGRIFGSRFMASGYELIVNGLAPGTYDIAVFAWSTVMQNFAPARTVRVVIR